MEMVDHPPKPNDWTMVVIHDNNNNNTDTYLFPPINHENLHIPSSSSSSSSSFDSSSFTSDSDVWTPSSSSPTSDSQVPKGADFFGWMNTGAQILRSKLFALFSPSRNPATANRGAFWSIGVLVMSCWIIFTMMKNKNKMKKRLSPNEARLINIIKEKDGKIAQLLHQIAQMNEILIDRHKALAAKIVE